MARTTAMQAASQNRAAHQHMPDDSNSSLKRASSTAISLLFSLDEASEKLGSSVSESLNEYDPVLEVQRIKQACALSEPELKLSHAVSEAKASSILTTGSVQLSHVGSYLRSKYGYLVVIRNANVAKRPRSYLRMLRHKYLVCRGLENMEGVDVLVDLNFKDHFVLPHSSSWYAQLVAALPQDWIGTATALAPLVGLMSAGMRLCFKQAGIPLPPWREGRAVLSKWVPEVVEDTPLPLVPLPDSALRRMLAPYHAPFRTALRTSGAATEPIIPQSARGMVYSSNVHCLEQQQQPPGSIGKPPLPRPPSGVALATAAVKAAAAGAAGALLLAVPASYTSAGGSSHNGNVRVVPDVPRKIIVGFPAQTFVPVPEMQRFPAAGAAPMGSDDMDVCSVADADAGVFVTRQWHQCTDAGISKKERQRQQLLVHQEAAVPAAATGSVISTMLSQQGDDTVHRGRKAAGLKALPQPEVALGCDTSAVKAVAVSQLLPTATAAAGSLQHRLQKAEQQQQQQPHGVHARPAFTSAVGLVTAACGNSPAIVMNQHLLQQLQAPSGTGAEQGKGSAAGAGEQRQFKALDQLLPRMRTVRLGAC